MRKAWSVPTLQAALIYHYSDIKISEMTLNQQSVMRLRPEGYEYGSCVATLMFWNDD